MEQDAILTAFSNAAKKRTCSDQFCVLVISSPPALMPREVPSWLHFSYHQHGGSSVWCQSSEKKPDAHENK
jgi:hypothetical protein